MKTDVLQIEHDAITQVEKEDECYTPPYGDERTNYIERHYVSNYTPKIFENLRYSRRTKSTYRNVVGKGGVRRLRETHKKGELLTFYVNPKTGKAMKSPVEAYMKEVDEALSNIIAPLRKIDVDVLNHLKAHIRAKIIKNQRETLARLRKEKEKH